MKRLNGFGRSLNRVCALTGTKFRSFCEKLRLLEKERNAVHDLTLDEVVTSFLRECDALHSH